MTSETPTLRTDFDRVQKRALAIGAVAALVAIAGALVDREQFFRSYLVAYLFWLGLSLGSFAIVMLHHLTGGSWGFAVRRVLEAGIRTLPLMALFFVPLLFALPRLYPWANTEIAAHDALLQHKAPYLNVPFFIVRLCVYFACWIGLGMRVLRLSNRSDRTGDPGPGRRARTLAGPALGIYAITMTFAAVDWAMSVETTWFSTMYGAIFIVGQVLATLAFAVVVAAWLTRRAPFSRFVKSGHFHDLGNLMFAFVMLWAYVNFSQYLIIWSGDLPEETPWYLHRTGHGWQAIAMAVIAFHFFVPFFLLLARRTKRSTRALTLVALLLIAMRFVDLFWLVGPAFHREGLAIHWMDPLLPIAIGGFWIAWFVRELKGRPLISLQDAQMHQLLDEPQHG